MEYGKSQRDLRKSLEKEVKEVVGDAYKDIKSKPEKEAKKYVKDWVVKGGMLILVGVLSKFSHLIVAAFSAALALHPIFVGLLAFAIATLVIGIVLWVFAEKFRLLANDFTQMYTAKLTDDFVKTLSDQEKTIFKRMRYGSKEHKKLVKGTEEKLTRKYKEVSKNTGVDVRKILENHAYPDEKYEENLNQAHLFLVSFSKAFKTSAKLRKLLRDGDILELEEVLGKHQAAVEGERFMLTDHWMFEHVVDVDLENTQNMVGLFLKSKTAFMNKKYSPSKIVTLVKSVINQLRVQKAIEDGKIGEVLGDIGNISSKELNRANGLINVLSRRCRSRLERDQKFQEICLLLYGKNEVDSIELLEIYILLNEASGGLLKYAISDDLKILEDHSDMTAAMESALENFSIDGITLPTALSFIRNFDEMMLPSLMSEPEAVQSRNMNHYEDPVDDHQEIVPAQRKTKIYEDDDEEGEGYHP